MVGGLFTIHSLVHMERGEGLFLQALQTLIEMEKAGA